MHRLILVYFSSRAFHRFPEAAFIANEHYLHIISIDEPCFWKLSLYRNRIVLPR